MKTLNNYFEKIYCINLDIRTDRYNESLLEFKKINVDVERISGVVGKDVFKVGLNRTAGAYGVFLTHIKILENVIKNNYENILIFEDDVMFVDNFNKLFNEKISSLPIDWDLLYIGGNNLFNKGKFNLITGDKNLNVDAVNYKTLKHELCKTTWTQCAHALAINKIFYQKLIDGMRKYSTQPIDYVHCLLQQEGCNAYTFLPSLALQRGSFSDIENVYIDYNKIDRWSF